MSKCHVQISEAVRKSTLSANAGVTMLSRHVSSMPQCHAVQPTTAASKVAMTCVPVLSRRPRQRHSSFSAVLHVAPWGGVLGRRKLTSFRRRNSSVKETFPTSGSNALTSKRPWIVCGEQIWNEEISRWYLYVQYEQLSTCRVSQWKSSFILCFREP